jgi:class 3 adenylate cyclase
VAVLTCPRCGQENPEGSRFCNACASPLEPEQPAAEERKTVSVVFIDLVGFTARAEQLDPEDVRAVLTPYHAHVRDELERRGGTVEKFIGDAVMAVFGAPAAHEDDPERAVRAALEIRDWSAEQSDVQVRIAVNTGVALVNLGARPAEGEAMVAGDVVNTAARMQSAAPVNGVLVGEMTYRATRDVITYREAEPIEAKGKAEPVQVWEAVEPVARFGLDLAERAATPLVGRDRELELLRSLLGRVRDERSAQLVTLVGVPGIGKSRLVSELFGMADAEPDLITWRQGRCLPYGESVTYWALGEIVKAEVGILETDAPPEAQRKLREALQRSVPDEAERRWLEGELEALVGLAGEGQSGGETAPAAWRRFLEAISDRGPGVLVFEDLHWADDGLLDFVDELVDWLRGSPLLLVGTARPELLERRPSWGGGKPNATTLSLQPLNEDDTARLVSGLLEQAVQLADDQRELLERAGGNPLFAEQYVRMLGERGAAGGELPESVHGVIAARLDALPRGEKELLQEAAVHGKVFWVGPVASARALARDEAEGVLRALERKDFVRRERRSSVAGDEQYAFHHVLLRDVAYGQIPRRARAEKHRAAAKWLEGLGRPEDHAELLAHHYQSALQLMRASGEVADPELVLRARESLRAAGDRALSLAAYSSAMRFYADAVELTPEDDPLRARLLLQQARASFPTGETDPAIIDEARKRFRAAGDREGEASAGSLAARIAWFAGDRPRCDALIAEAVAAGAEVPESRAYVEALSNQSGFHMLAGNYDESIAVVDEALPRAEALGMEDQRARLLIVRGTARSGQGNREGLAEVERGIAVAQEAGAMDMVATGYSNLTSNLGYFAQLPEAKAAWEEVWAVSRRYGLTRFLTTTSAEAAGWAYVEGRWEEADAICAGRFEAIDRGETVFSDGSVMSLRAWMRLARGDDEGADEDSARAAAFARTSDIQAQASAFSIRPAIAHALGLRDEADRVASELLAWGEVMVGALGVPFPTLVDAAWSLRDLGRQDEFAAKVLDPDVIRSRWNDAARAICDGDFASAAEVIGAIGHTAGAAYAHLRAAEAGGEEAAEHRARAEAFYRDVGATAFLKRLEDAVGTSAR